MLRNDDSDSPAPAPKIANKINPFSILADNAVRGLFWGYPREYNPVEQAVDAEPEERTYLDGLKAAIHTFLLPTTMTVGLGAKTIIDCASRKPLSDEEMLAMKTRISEMNDDEFDGFIANICTYVPKSGASRQLVDTLSQEDKHMQAMKAEVEGEIRARIKQDCLSKMDPEIAKSIKIEINETFQFSEDQQLQIDVRLKEERLIFRLDHREGQRQAVLNYLDDGANAGKKMEHVIKGSVESVSQRMMK